MESFLAQKQIRFNFSKQSKNNKSWRYSHAKKLIVSSLCGSELKLTKVSFSSGEIWKKIQPSHRTWIDFVQYMRNLKIESFLLKLLQGVLGSNLNKTCKKKATLRTYNFGLLQENSSFFNPNKSDVHLYSQIKLKLQNFYWKQWVSHFFKFFSRKLSGQDVLDRNKSTSPESLKDAFFQLISMDFWLFEKQTLLICA